MSAEDQDLTCSYTSKIITWDIIRHYREQRGVQQHKKQQKQEILEIAKWGGSDTESLTQGSNFQGIYATHTE